MYIWKIEYKIREILLPFSEYRIWFVKDVEKVYEELTAHGVSCVIYHAGRSLKQRKVGMKKDKTNFKKLTRVIITSWKTAIQIKQINKGDLISCKKIEKMEIFLVNK